MDSDRISIDLHGMKFVVAKVELLEQLEGYCRSGYTTFEVIHGHTKGTVIRNYVRDRLKGEFESRNPKFTCDCSVQNKGTTLIHIKSKG